MWHLLLDPAIGSFFGARLVASIGIWIHNVVAAVVVYQITGSAFMVGVVSVAQFGTQLLFTPFMGALADRGNRQVQASVGQLITASGPGLLSLWLTFSASELSSPWPVVAASLLVGIGFTVGAPATQALVPSLGRKSELSSVVVLTTAPITVARATGPGLGALILVTRGPAMAFAVTAVTQVILAIAIRWIRFQPSTKVTTGDQSVRRGFRYLRSDTGTMLLLVGVAGIGFGVDPIITLSPAIADDLGAGAELVALIASAFGVGAGTFLLVFSPLRKAFGYEVLASRGLWLMAASMAGLALSRTPALVVVSSLIGGLGFMAALTSSSTQIQERAPDEFRGRIMALWLVALVGSRPLAAAANGLIADTLSTDAALTVVVIILLTVGFLVRPSRLAAPPRSVA